MDLKLKDKIVLVTGGAGIEGSIGHTIVFAVAAEGAVPLIFDRNERGFDYEKQLQERGIPAKFFKTDLSDAKQIENSIEKVKAEYGHLHAIINNVGVNDGIRLEDSVEDFVDSLKLNLISYFVVVKHALPLLRKVKGNILNIGSKVALTGQGGTSGYAASKGGVLGLTREWSVDLISSGIRVNALIIAESLTPAYHNWLKTLENGEAQLKSIEDKIPLGNRMTTPEEIADTTLFLISERSSHTTGQFIYVDGGYVHLDRALLNH